MPKRVTVSIETPVDVSAAIEAFGTQLRVHLIRYFATNPGTRQADAVRALGVDRAVVSFNAGVLTELDVLQVASDRTYRVDRHRVRHLASTLGTYAATG